MFKESEISLSRIFWIDTTQVKIPIHSRLGFPGSADWLSAAAGYLGTCTKLLRRDKYPYEQKKCHRYTHFRCSLTPHNACWLASSASTRYHVRLGAVPLEAGRHYSISPALIAYMFPMKGSGLALLGHRRGGSPGGQSNCSLVLLSFTYSRFLL